MKPFDQRKFHVPKLWLGLGVFARRPWWVHKRHFSRVSAFRLLLTFRSVRCWLADNCVNDFVCVAWKGSGQWWVRDNMVLASKHRLAPPLSDLINVQSLIVSSPWRVYLFCHLRSLRNSSSIPKKWTLQETHNRMDLFVFTFLIHSPPIKSLIVPFKSTHWWKHMFAFKLHLLHMHSDHQTMGELTSASAATKWQNMTTNMSMLMLICFVFALFNSGCRHGEVSDSSDSIDSWLQAGRSNQLLSIRLTHLRAKPTNDSILAKLPDDCYAARCKLVAGAKTHVNSNYWSPRVKLRGAWKQKPF